MNAAVEQACRIAAEICRLSGDKASSSLLPLQEKLAAVLRDGALPALLLPARADEAPQQQLDSLRVLQSAADLYMYVQQERSRAAGGTADNLSLPFGLLRALSSEADASKPSAESATQQTQALARLLQSACDMHCLVALDEAPESIAAEVASDRLQLCIGAAKAWIALRDPSRAEACLSCARHTIPQVLCDVVSTLSLSRSAGAASVSARLDEGLALVHDMLLFHSVLLWHTGNHAASQSTASECAAVVQEVAMPASAQLGRALCAELADTLVTIGSKAVQQITQPTAAPSTAASPPSALPTLHAAQEMLELAHEVVEYGFACQTECLKEQEQQGRESQQVKSDEKQSGDHDMDGQGDQQQSKPDVKQEQKGSADEQLQKQNTQAHDLLASVRERVLLWMSLCHLSRYAAAKALQCLDALLHVQAPCTQDPSFLRIRLEALLLMDGRHQDAITHALTALLTSASASPDLCLEALELVLLSLSPSFHTAAALPASAPGAALNSARLEVGSAAAENGSEGQQQNQQQQEKLQGLLLPAFQLLVKRVPAERGVLTVQLLFKAVQAFQAGATGVTSSMLDSLTTALLLPGISQSSAPQQQEEGAEGLLRHLEEMSRSEAGGSKASEEASAEIVKSACRELVWERGMHHFNTRNFPAAIPFFKASMTYAPELNQMLEAHKALTLCCLATQKLDKALEHLNLSESLVLKSSKGAAQQQQLTVDIPFVKLKICLEQQDVEGAAKQLKRMPACVNFTPHVLEVVCQEAVHAHAHTVACDALAILHEAVMRGEDVAGLSEADILRLHIRCFEMSGEQQQSQASKLTSQPPKSTTFAFHDNLARLYNTVRGRLDTVGFAAFFGVKSDQNKEESGQKQQEVPAHAHAALQWFADTAIKVAAAAGRATVPQACTVLYAASANILAHHPNPSQPRILRCRRISFTMAAVAALEVHAKNPTVVTALDLAKSLLASSKKMAAEILAISDGPASALMGSPALLADDVERTVIYHEVVAALRSSDKQELRRLLCEELPSRVPHARPSGDMLVRLADMMAGEPYKDTANSLACYQLALQQLAVEASPELELVPEVLRRVIELTSGDKGRLATYREASQIMGQLAAQAASAAKVGSTDAGRAGPMSGGGGVKNSGGHRGSAGGPVSGGGKRESNGVTMIGGVVGKMSGGKGSAGGKGSGGRDVMMGRASAADAAAEWKRTCFGEGRTVEWLVSSCWNRGAHLSRLLRPAEAADFMRAALALLPFMPAVYETTHKPMMEASLLQQMNAAALVQPLLPHHVELASP